jgi:adenylate cyclase
MDATMTGKNAMKENPSPREMFIPIGVKLIGIVSLILVSALAGMTILATSFFSNDVARSVTFNTLDRADLISQKLDAELRTYISAGQLIAASMEGGLVLQGTDSSMTDQLLRQNPMILETWIVGRNGTGFSVQKAALKKERLEAVGVEAPDGNNVLSHYQATIASCFSGATVLENVSPDFDYPILALCFPYGMKNDSETESIVVVIFSMDQIFESLKSRELYVSYLVDSRGTLLANIDPLLVIARPSLKDNPIVKDSLAASVENKQMRYSDEKGRPMLGSYKRFFEGRLTAVSEVREDTALANVYAIQKRNLLITVMIQCGAMLFLFFYSKTITTPVRRLVDATNLVREGNYSVTISTHNHDEIGRLAHAFTDMSKGLAEREKIKTAFGKFVNKEIAERVLRDEIQLGGESRQAAIFFSDIRSFTAISEKLTPHEIVEFLNAYMTRMVDCVNKTHGVVDKFIGDAIMAVWGAPYSRGNDTENAINCALMMRNTLAAFNKGRGGARTPIIKIGSGINTGEIIAGQIGSLERMEYTCIGDPVNLASRIESLTKPFQTDILISQHSYELVKGIFKVEPMKKITVKGKIEPQQVYAVIGRLDDPRCMGGLKELRAFLGWQDVSLDDVDADAQEEKYEIVK